MTILKHTLFFFLLVTQISFAQWMQTNGPYGGNIGCFAVSDTNLFVGMLGDGVCRSTNNGTSWTPVNEGLTSTDVNAFAISGKNIFAGTGSFMGGGGVFVSPNNGTSWNSSGLNDYWIKALAISDTNIFAGTYLGGVFLSTNNGTSWIPVSNGIEETVVNAFAFTSNEEGGTNIFAGIGGKFSYVKGIFLSTNNGASWNASGLQDFWVNTLLAASSNGESGTILFAGTYYGGVFRSTDNGTSWTEVNIGLEDLRVYALAINGTNLFAGTYGGGVFRSNDNGTSWTPINEALTNTEVLALVASGTNLFAGTEGGGVFLSTDDGSNWTGVSTGLTNIYVRAFAVSGMDFFAGTYGGGVFLSTNNGASWSAGNNGLTNNDVLSLAVSGTTLFAGTYGSGVFCSNNNGSHWIPTGLTNGTINTLAIDDNNLFAGTNNGIFLSTDNGTSWTSVNNGLTHIEVLSFVVFGTNLFAGTFGGGVFCSINNGSNWIQTGLTYGIINSLAADDNNLFAGTNSGIFLSTDNGTSWTPVNSGLTDSTGLSFAFIGDNIFAGTGYGGIFLSNDNGTNWTEVNAGLTNNNYVLSIYACGEHLFAGTNNSVWRRPLSEMITDVEDFEQLPTEFSLSQNFPNPFNPSTRIKYSVPFVETHRDASLLVTLKVYDVLGNEIETLVNDEKPAGTYEVNWNAVNLPSGVYFYQLRAGDYMSIKKMILLK